MKGDYHEKRLLCALLAAAMCFGETLSASAVTVSTNDVEMEQTGTISENTTEVDAEKEAATIIRMEKFLPSSPRDKAMN